MGLDLTHGRDVALRDLVMVLHIVLQGLVIIVLHFLVGCAPIFVELVSLVVSFGHCDLILRIHGQLRV